MPAASTDALGPSTGPTAQSHPTSSRVSPSAAPADPNTDFVAQQVRLRAGTVGRTMRATTPLVRGTLARGAEAMHEIDVAAGHCYRIVVVGGVEVDDLDLSLFAPDGSEIDNDPPGESYPTLGATRPFCPPSGGRYRVRVRMASGQGDYGLQVFGTP